MKRVLLAVLALVLLFILSVVVAVGSAFVGSRPLVAQSVGVGDVVLDGYTSVTLIDAGEGQWILIDAGNDGGGASVLAALQARGAGPDAVKAIFLTHGHPDHVAGCGLFPNATVYAMQPEQDTLEGKRAYKGPLPSTFGPKPAPCAVAGLLQDGATVQVGNRNVEAFLVPGHTTGSGAYLIEGVLFVGDSMGAKTDGLVGAPWVFSDDTAENVESMKALAKRLAGRVTLVVPAHTGTATGEELGAF